MFYSGDEFYGDEITSVLDHPDWDDDGYCDYCERPGHSFSTCEKRDDYGIEDE